MAEFSGERDQNSSELYQEGLGEISSMKEENTSQLGEKEDENSNEISEPRLVRLKRRNQSFGLKVRGQVTEGGPRWLIDGKVYKNLHTVSAVAPQSTAEECGVKVGDKILSINGVSVEGVEHETIKKYMSSSGDDVEILVVTPGEAKMLDIPASLVIHRSDGSMTSINKSMLLRNETIDEVLENEDKESDKESVIQVQVHMKTDKQEETEAQNVDDNQNQPEDNEEHLNDFKEEETACNSDKEASDEASQADQKQDDDEEVVETSENAPSQETSEIDSNIEDFAENSKEQGEENSNDEITQLEENMEEKDHLGGEEDLPVENLEEGNEDLMKGEEEEEVNEQLEDVVPSRKNSTETCSCGSEGNKDKRNLKRRKENERDKLIRQMRVISSSIKRFKISPFSPDTFNNLSPYFSVDLLDEDSHTQVKMGQARSWRYSHQRPTALMVLDPAEALRLENSDLERQVKVWSSNFAGKERVSTSEANDEAVKLREELSKVYENLMKKRLIKSKENLNRYLHDEKFISLSKRFIKANAKNTFLTYMNHWKVS